jgi:hypothetical protein
MNHPYIKYKINMNSAAHKWLVMHSQPCANVQRSKSQVRLVTDCFGAHGPG